MGSLRATSELPGCPARSGCPDVLGGCWPAMLSVPFMLNPVELTPALSTL